MTWSTAGIAVFMVLILSPYWLIMVCAWLEGDRHFVWQFPLVIAVVGLVFMVVGSFLQSLNPYLR